MLDASYRANKGHIALVHAEQLNLCRVLESIADGLPNGMDAATCLSAAEAINRVMLSTSGAERSELDAAISERRARTEVDLAPIIERLLRENAEDVAYAEELQETLHDFGTGRPRLSTDALGYMLRAFFESRRRHVALEQELLSGIIAK